MWNDKKFPKDPLVYLAAVGAATVGVYSRKLFKTALIKSYLSINRFRIEKDAKLLLERRDLRVKEFYEKHKNDLSEKRIEEIVYLSASELAFKIRNKEIKSREAVIAYSLRASTIGIKLHLINDVFFEEALLEADLADKLIESTDDVNSLPPLIGMPMTIKDCLHYKGKTTTIGCKHLAGKISTYDSHAVAVIKKEGAIPYCFTNVPQNLFSAESSNYLWGATENPWDRTRTPGGSSGGCAGAIAAYCSPLTIAADIGGSIRVPASFNGLYGLKPSHSRITIKDQIKPTGDEYSGWKTWLTAPGTISRSYEDLLLFARAFYGKYDEDYSIPQKLFDEKAYSEGLTNYFNPKKKAKIGICKGFKLSMPFNEQYEALEKVKKHFISLGHEVVDFDFEDHMQLYDKAALNISVVLKIITLSLRGEKPYYFYKTMNYRHKHWILKLFYRNYYKLIGKERIALRYPDMERLDNTLRFLSNSKIIDELKERFYDQLKKNEIDTIIMPIIPFPAPKRLDFDYFPDHIYYCLISNILNLSGGAIPVKLIEDNTYVTPYNDSIAESIKRSMKDAVGQPFGLQVLTLPYQDEKALRLLKELDNVFKFSEDKKVWDAHKSKVNLYK